MDTDDKCSTRRRSSPAGGSAPTASTPAAEVTDAAAASAMIDHATHNATGLPAIPGVPSKLTAAPLALTADEPHTRAAVPALFCSATRAVTAEATRLTATPGVIHQRALGVLSCVTTAKPAAATSIAAVTSPVGHIATTHGTLALPEG